RPSPSASRAAGSSRSATACCSCAPTATRRAAAPPSRPSRPARAARRRTRPPLGADALAVDDAHLAEAARRRLLKVLAHHRPDIARGERVEVEGVLDRQDDRLSLLLVHGGQHIPPAGGRPAGLTRPRPDP